MQYRNTWQKQYILKVIDDCGHITTEELIDYLKRNNNSISISTIYRNLSVLTDEGKIKKIQNRGIIVYETIKQEHYHFECQICHKIYDIDPSLIKIKNNHSNWVVTKTNLFMYGICDNCNNNIK